MCMDHSLNVYGAAHIIARPHREVEPALGNGNFLGQKD